MRKILFISTNDWTPWGGSEELWYRTALLLKGKGFDVYVSIKFWQPVPEHIAKLEKSGCKIDFRLSSQSDRFYKRAFYKIFRITQDPFYILDNINPDLVIINQGSISGGIEWGEASYKRNINYAFVIQLVNELNVLGDQFINKLIQVLSKAKANFFVSKQNSDLLEAILAFKLNNSVLVHNPYKGTNLIPYPVSTETFNIAFIASLNSFHKGHDMLFRVLKEEKWKQRNIKFHLFGNGPNEETLKRLKSYNELDHVFFLGFEPDLQKIYEYNHAFILCSRMEGQSLALIEAMYCGRVSIVTNVGGAGELIDDGIDGFIATSANINEIDKNLERAWNQRYEWEKMGKLAAQKIRERLNGDPVEIFAQKLALMVNAI